MMLTYLMPSASVVSLAESPCVKVVTRVHKISPDICNKVICLGGQMNDIKNKKITG